MQEKVFDAAVGIGAIAMWLWMAWMFISMSQ